MIVAADLLQGNILRVIKDLNEQTLWPPLHSLLQFPFMLINGKTFYSSSLCSLAFLIFFFPALTLAYSKLTSDWSGWIVLMGFAATSPYLLGYGTMPMLEIFGATLTFLSVSLYLSKSKWFPLSLTGLFFLKYNYCIYLLLPLACIEAAGHFRNKPFTIQQTASKLKGFNLLIAAFIFFFLFVLLTGGFKIGKISVRGIGNPMYLLLVILTIRLMSKQRYVHAWRSIRGTGWEWFVIPVYLWLLIPVPNRMKTLVSFAINAPLGGQSPWDLSYYTFYPHALGAYFSNFALAITCVLGATILAILKRKDSRVVFLALLFLLPLLLMTVNQNKQERYLFTFVPCLWLLCSFGISSVKNIFLRYGTSLALACALVFSYNTEAVQAVVGWPFVPPVVDEPVRYISNVVGKANEIRILGVKNDMSPGLLMYHIMKRNNFELRPNFKRTLEKNPPPKTHIIFLGQPMMPEAKVREFPGGILVGHFVYE